MKLDHGSPYSNN